MLESHLALVKIQLQTLYLARERLTAVFTERSRVIDLLCYAVPCIGQYTSNCDCNYSVCNLQTFMVQNSWPQ